MMNLQRLEEVRSNLEKLISIASIIGPGDDISGFVSKKLEEFGILRDSIFKRRVAKGTEPIIPIKEIVPEPVRHNHITRDIKPLGKCPSCDEYHARHPSTITIREPKKSELPQAPAQSRRVSSNTSYNPERYQSYKVLWAKVIIRAAYDYALWKDSKDMRLRKYAMDAERWVFEHSDLPLSFESICFAYDFPVERIRQKTRMLTKNDVKKLEFRERSGRIGTLLGAPDGDHE